MSHELVLRRSGCHRSLPDRVVAKRFKDGRSQAVRLPKELPALSDFMAEGRGQPIAYQPGVGSRRSSAATLLSAFQSIDPLRIAAEELRTIVWRDAREHYIDRMEPRLVAARQIAHGPVAAE